MKIITPKGEIFLDAFEKRPFNPVRISSENEYVTRYIIDNFEIGVSTGSEDDKKLRKIIGQEAVVTISEN